MESPPSGRMPRHRGRKPVADWAAACRD